MEDSTTLIMEDIIRQLLLRGKGGGSDGCAATRNSTHQRTLAPPGARPGPFRAARRPRGLLLGLLGALHQREQLLLVPEASLPARAGRTGS